MPIVVECPSCGQKLKVPENLEGKKVRCSKCQGTFTAEPPAAAPPPTPREEPAEQPPEDDYDDRPARRSKRRRDDDDEDGRDRGSPGRGGMLLTFGIISIAAAVLTGACGWIPYVGIVALVFPFIGLAFGIMAWAMGGGDLKKIKQGSIRQAAKGSTQGGYICGIVGTVLNSLIFVCGCILLIVGLIFGLAIFSAASNAAMQSQKAGNAVPFNNPAPKRSFGLPPAKLADYMPRIQGLSN
jgi:hypothetical protein